MKEIRLRSAAVFGAMLLVCPMGGLKSVASPHAGEYECKTLTFGGRELLSHFAEVTLELKGDGTGILHCKDKAGGRRELPLCYEYGEGEEKMLFLYQSGGKELRVPALYEKGEIVFTYQAGENLLLAIFSK